MFLFDWLSIDCVLQFRTAANGQANNNMTNLAIKGLVGIQAMSEISRALGQDNDAASYAVGHSFEVHSIFLSYTDHTL